MDCLEIHERGRLKRFRTLSRASISQGRCNSVRRVKSKGKKSGGRQSCRPPPQEKPLKIVVIQLANYTLAFFHVDDSRKNSALLFIRNKENIMNKFFVKFTDPLYNITRRLIPFAKEAASRPSPFFLLYSSVFYL